MKNSYPSASNVQTFPSFSFPSTSLAKIIQKILQHNPVFTVGQKMIQTKYICNQYSHPSNNHGGWNKRVEVQKLQNQLDFSHQFIC